MYRSIFIASESHCYAPPRRIWLHLLSILQSGSCRHCCSLSLLFPRPDEPSSFSLSSSIICCNLWFGGFLVQMHPHRCQKEGNDHFSGSAGYSLANTAQDVSGLLSSSMFVGLCLKTSRSFSTELFSRQLPTPAYVVILSQMQAFSNKVRNE